MTHQNQQPTTRWVPDDYGCLWRHCTAGRTKHPPVPPWYTNEPYSKGETWWQHMVRLRGLEEMCERRQVHLDGFRDRRGNWWCGHCFYRQRFMNVGERLEYPCLYDFYQVPETRDVVGYEAWLRLASTASAVLIEIAVRAIKRRLASEASGSSRQSRRDAA